MTWFPHDEYHIYTTDSSLNKKYVHLEPSLVKDARAMQQAAHEMSGRWEHVHRTKVADGIYLVVGDEPYCPRLKSPGYEGWESCDPTTFDESVAFDSMIFHKCIGRAFEGEAREPDWSFSEVREWVNYEHRGQFENEFDEYLTEYHDPDEVRVDW